MPFRGSKSAILKFVHFLQSVENPVELLLAAFMVISGFSETARKFAFSDGDAFGKALLVAVVSIIVSEVAASLFVTVKISISWASLGVLFFVLTIVILHLLALAVYIVIGVVAFQGLDGGAVLGVALVATEAILLGYCRCRNSMFYIRFLGSSLARIGGVEIQIFEMVKHGICHSYLVITSVVANLWLLQWDCLRTVRLASNAIDDVEELAT